MVVLSSFAQLGPLMQPELLEGGNFEGACFEEDQKRSRLSFALHHTRAPGELGGSGEAEPPGAKYTKRNVNE